MGASRDDPHRIAVVALVADGRVLLVHRHPRRAAYPDCWDLVGGHVEPGEQPEGAAVRECREEVGVEVGELRPIAWTVRDPALEVHAYAASRWVGEPRNLAPREHDDLRWFGREELAGLRMAHPGTLGDLLRVVEEGP